MWYKIWYQTGDDVKKIILSKTGVKNSYIKMWVYKKNVSCFKLVT